MDKKKQTMAPAQRPERQEQKKTSEDRKNMRKTKGAEPDENTSSELQQQSSKEEMAVIKSDQSDGNVRMKIRVATKRTKKPPKSLENFICRPTVRISQRLAHGDGQSSCGGEASGSEITAANQSNQEVQRKDSNDCISPKASTTPFPTSSKKADSTCFTAPSKKAPSKQTKKTDSKSLLTDGSSYAVHPQTDCKVPLSDRIASSTPLKQTYSPPAAPSPPSSFQQNSSPHDSVQVFNVQKLKGDHLPTGATVTASISSHSSKDTTQSSQQSPSSVENDSHQQSCADNALAIKQMPCAPKKTKTSKIRDRNPEKCLNVSAKEDSKKIGDSKNVFKTVTNKRSKNNDSGHQGISVKTLSVLPVYKSADSSVPESSTCSSEVQESKVRSVRQNEGEDIEDSRKKTVEPPQTLPVAVQPKDGKRVGHTFDRNKRRARHISGYIDDERSSQTTSCPDPQYNTSIHSTHRTSDEETHLHPKQTSNSQKKQKVVQMANVANQMEKMDLVETANISSDACKTVPETSKLKKISISQYKPRPVGRPPKHKLQNLPPRSEVTSHVPQPKKRGRPKMIRLDKTSQGIKSHTTCTKSTILKHTNVSNPEVDLRLQMPVQRKRGRPRLSSSIQPHKSFDSASVRKGAEENYKPSLSKTKDIQICRKRNRLIMKTIIKNINKMRMKKKDEVLTQFLSRQKQCYKPNFAQNGNEEDAECSVSDPTQSLSSLVTSFGGKLGPQINVSKRGTIYIGKRRGRKPKTQKENFGQDSDQIVVQKSQQMADSLSHLHSWSSPGEHSQSVLCSSPHLFKHPEPPSSTAGCFRRKLYTGNCDQYFAQKANSSQKAVAEEGFKPHSTLQSTTLPLATTQLGSDCRTVHLAKSVLMEQERPKYKCHRKGQNCFSRDKIRKHKHKCRRKYLQLRAKRQDPEFLAEVEDLVVRLSAIRIVHHIPQGVCGDEAKSGRKCSKGKKYPHVHQCLPQNLHHPTMFQINFSGYYSPQSDFPRDSLHYVGMKEQHLKKSNRCPSQPAEHIVTHCPVVHKLAFPLTGGGCYHPSCKMPLSATSFGFGLYRGYPPSATLYPSSPFLPSYVHPYSKNLILSPSKFHKRKQKFLRRDSPLCGGKPYGTYSNVASQSSSDWFNRNSWQRVDNRDKRLVDDGLRKREGIGGLLGQSNLRKEHASRRSSHSLFSSSVPTKNTDKHKISHLSFIGPAQLKPISKVRWAEHQQSWRWRGRVEPEKSSNTLNQEVESDYQEDDTLVGPENDEDLPSPFLSDRTTCHHSFLKNPNLASSAKRQMTVQRSTAEVQCASRNLMRPGSSLMKGPCLSGDKRVSEGFQSGGPLFHEHYQHLTKGQNRGGRDPRHNVSRTFIQTNKISPFSSTATKSSFFHSRSSTTTALAKRKMKYVIKPLASPKSPQSQTVTGSQGKRRGPGRPRKNSAPCFSSSLPAALLYHGAMESPSKHRNADITAFNALDDESVSEYEKRKGRKKRDIEKLRDGEQVDGTAVGQEPLRSHTGSSSPFQDVSESEYSQSETSSALPLDKKYERAGLYSDVYKTEAPTSLSSPENTECLEYDPEEHKYGLLPAPIHVGKYLRLKRLDFQLPYDIYWLCAHNKLEKMSDSPSKTTISNGCVGVMSLTQPKDRSYKHHKDSVPHECISDSLNRDDSLRLPAEKVGEEISETELDNKLPNQSDPLKQQERGNDAENIPSPLLIMPLSCEERSFIVEHSIFLVRNYEKIRERQAVLLKEGMREQEKEDEEYRGSGQCQTGVLEDTSTKSDRHLTLQSEDRLDEKGRESRNLPQTLQGIYDVIVSYKGSSGQTLAAPLLNLCSRKRSGSAPVDLSTLQKQLLSGCYESLDAFHSDMLRVFQCAEKYYGCESSVGRNVRQLREVYHSAHQEALTHIGNFL